jgi:hypothetical protein
VHDADPRTLADIWVLPMLGSTSVVLKTPFRELWNYFRRTPVGGLPVDESGPRPESTCGLSSLAGEHGVATTGGYRRVSTAGGIMPAWRPMARSVHLNPAGAMATPIAVWSRSGRAPVMFSDAHHAAARRATGRRCDVAPMGLSSTWN